MSFIKAAKAGVVWTFLQQFSVQIINFGVQIVLARLLMPSDFGLIAMITVFISIGQSLSDSGMTSSLIRNEKNTEEDYNTVFVTNLCVSLIIYCIVYILAPFVADFYNQEVLVSLLRVFSLTFVISSFNVVQVTRFMKDLNFKKQFTYQLPSVLVGALAGIYSAYIGMGVWSIVILNIVQSAAFGIFLYLFYEWRPIFQFNREKFKYHFDYGYKLTLSGLLHTIYLNLYKIIIGKKFSVSSVGYFTQADNLRLFPVNQLSLVLNKVTFPLFASIQNDNEKLKKAYQSALRLVLSVTAALMFILIILAEPLFSLVFGNKWLPSVPYFQILCIASIFLPIGTYNLNILKIKGRSDLFLKIEVIKKIIGIVSLIISIPFGINAIVWTLCITNIFFAYFNAYFSGKFINYTLFDQIKNSITIIVLAVLPFLCTYYFVNKSGVLTDVNNVFIILTGGAVYLILFLPLLYFFNKPLLADIKLVLKR